MRSSEPWTITPSGVALLLGLSLLGSALLVVLGGPAGLLPLPAVLEAVARIVRTTRDGAGDGKAGAIASREDPVRREEVAAASAADI